MLPLAVPRERSVCNASITRTERLIPEIQIAQPCETTCKYYYVYSSPKTATAPAVCVISHLGRHFQMCNHRCTCSTTIVKGLKKMFLCFDVFSLHYALRVFLSSLLPSICVHRYGLSLACLLHVSHTGSAPAWHSKDGLPREATPASLYLVTGCKGVCNHQTLGTNMTSHRLQAGVPGEMKSARMVEETKIPSTDL